MADNLTTFMCRLSRNLWASTSWNPKGLSRPVMGLLYLSYVRRLSALSLSFKDIRQSSTDAAVSFRFWSVSQFYAEDTQIERCSNYKFWRSWPVLRVSSVVLPEIYSACDRVFSLRSDRVPLNFFQGKHSTPFQIHYSSSYISTLYSTS
jgi:hypothetical protein